MTMDFAQPPAAGSGMLPPVRAALNATHAQLADLFPRYGIHLRSQQIWQRMGAIVMIGQNNVGGENFTVSDAQGLVSFAGNDQPVAANTNPADAPYPQWSALGDYPSGYKVVENGEIYQSKWYNTGDDPQTQVQYSWQTPWELLGPVLPGDHAAVLPQIPPGTYPTWSVTGKYKAGEKVLYLGLPYQAKWENQGVSPLIGQGDPSGSPWKALYRTPGEPVSPAIAATIPATGATSPSSAVSPSPP